MHDGAPTGSSFSIRCFSESKPMINGFPNVIQKHFVDCGTSPNWLITLRFLAGHDVYHTSSLLEIFLQSPQCWSFCWTLFCKASLMNLLLLPSVNDVVVLTRALSGGTPQLRRGRENWISLRSTCLTSQVPHDCATSLSPQIDASLE